MIDQELQGHYEALDREIHRKRMAVAKLMARLTVWLDEDQFNEADEIMNPEFEPQPKPLDDPKLQQLFGDAIWGAYLKGRERSDPPPDGHWLTRWWHWGSVATAIPVADLMGLLPGPYYMDLPDGGDTTILEQLQRMSEDAARYRFLRGNKLNGEEYDRPYIHAAERDDRAWGYSGEEADAVVDEARATQGGFPPSEQEGPKP